MKKIQAVDVTTGKVETINEKRRSATRSKTEEKQKKLISWLLFSSDEFKFIDTNFKYSKELLDLCLDFTFGTKSDLDYFAKAIVKTRKEGWNKQIAILALVLLSTGDNDYAKQKFREIFNKVILSLDDLDCFLSIIKTKMFRGFGKIIQKQVNIFFDSLTVFDIVEYIDQCEINASDYKFKLRDIIKYCHVKPKNQVTTAIYAYLVRKAITKKLPTLIVAHKDLSTLTQDQIVPVLKNNNFPFSIVKRHSLTINALNETAFERASFTDLISNFEIVNEMIKDVDLKREIKRALSDEKVIKTSNLTPFHFLKAYIKYHHTDLIIEAEIKRCIEKALELSYINVAHTNKNIAIIIDQSARSKGSNSFYPNVNDSFVINSFASIFSKISSNSWLIPFCVNSSLIQIPEMKTLEIAEQINMSTKGVDPIYTLPFKKLRELQEVGQVVDTILCISSDVSWFNLLRQTLIAQELSAYLNKIGPDYQTKMIFWRLSGTEANRTHNLRNAMFVSGFNYHILKFITDYITGQLDNLVEKTNQLI